MQVRRGWLGVGLLIVLAVLVTAGARWGRGGDGREQRGRTVSASSGPRDAATSPLRNRQAQLVATESAQRPVAVAVKQSAGAVPRVLASPPVTKIRSVEPDVPWGHAGMCVDGLKPDVEEARARYLATFVATPGWHTTIYAHPLVAAPAVDQVRDNLERIHQFATAQIGLPSEPPSIYLYPSVAELRAHSCTSKTAVAYYDGAIHLAVEGDAYELQKSLRHEYAHHVLVSHGIGKPLWFQEGTAMWFAHDCPHNAWQLWRSHPFDPKRMVDGAPHTASLPDATVWSAQACVMTELLDRLCLARTECHPAELAQALIARQATPTTLFDWAISRRGADLFRTTPLALWDDYAQRGDFAPATKDALLHRARPVRGDGG